jgi:outer membrane receptor protein involved in Fe transport
LLFTLPVAALAHENPLEETTVTGKRVNLIGEAVSASEGVVGQAEIRVRPILRTGEIMELVPGMIATQHSGTGKANQYFLRGFNLDHGTDFATFVDGMPVNMRSHGHGQGYTDLNFLIPELVQTLSYKKGTYYAEVGDFSGAGSAAIATADRLGGHSATVTAGEDSYLRGLAMGTLALGQGLLTYGLEGNRYDGPWKDIDEDMERTNGLLKYRIGDFSFTFMGYDNAWNSADQIPLRAVKSGLIDELGSIDDTLGGESSRYSYSLQWQSGHFEASAYAIDYDLDLWSNFTYLLDDPVNGDQFEQVDDRWIYGGAAKYRDQFDGAGGRTLHTLLGVDYRFDDIDEVGLYRTQGRKRLGVVSDSSVQQWSTGLFGELRVDWSGRFTTMIGIRYDYFDFDVDSDVSSNVNGVDLTANGGTADDDRFSLKGSLGYRLSDAWELYAAAGQGFHSNDARGTTIAVDPVDGSPVQTVDPLVESLGGEVGARVFDDDKLNASLALWYLELDSELLFVGDAATTEPSGKSERYGVEVTAWYRLTPNWSLDLEYAWTEAEFTDAPSSENKVPGAAEQVVQAGVSADYDNGYFGSLRVRYLGERPLTESGDIKSDDSIGVNLRAGYRWQHLSVYLDALNLLDSDDDDITYYYASRLPGEPAGGVEDIHYHVMEPRTLRLTLAYAF